MGEGMPIHRDPFEKGRLIIQFLVKFPDRIPPEKIVTLESCLPPREEHIIPDDADHVDLIEFDPQQEQTSSRRGEAYESDDDHPHGQRVQCASH